MEITNSKLSNYILYSNKNLEKLCRSLINESANAVLLESYNDKLLLADHNSGAIYLADYKFDGKVLTIENYENVDIVNDNSQLNEAINDYFKNDNYDVALIAEAYENDSEAMNTELNDSIVEALASKRSDVIDYTELYGINEDLEEITEKPFFNRYKEYLMESPTSSIKFFDWENPVRVSLIDEDADRTIDILKEALKLQSAGCFAVVLELMPLQSSQFVTQRLRIPTIGIGGGKFCDGQVLVSDDLLGKYDRFKPKFARQYANLKDIILDSTKAYCDDVLSGEFPNNNESFMLDAEEEEKLENYW